MQKRYGFLFFAKNMAENICKNMSGKYTQKPLCVKISGTDALKTASKRAIQKIAEATGNLINNKIKDTIIGTTQTKSITSMQTENTTENNQKDQKKIKYLLKKDKIIITYKNRMKYQKKSKFV